ncbi:bacterial translation initiation factor 2 (bIF-2) [Thalassoporum mexicanum PCC 7367]|uniref:translation initiation factor IF-2 n=1 Tax=Thalassoporum mexicanum TaxID=3457544 RepID=UPI00029FD032|nr:translation initiation factor IF-2 [Pseudanabaena sp. PCC 7367]AFY70037.1 bacterial translation initiation factor 2 (bIF-2) [Pseudanabaena sp. PCC 7367]
MSISRVRVYELKRELDLETKEILGICDRLGIPVKSHSSTITEAEADRIRNFAQNRDQSAKLDKSEPEVAEPVSSANKESSTASASKQEILINTVSRPATIKQLQKPTAAEPPAPSRPVVVEPSPQEQAEPAVAATKPSKKNSKATTNTKGTAQNTDNGAIAKAPTSSSSAQLKQPPARPAESAGEVVEISEIAPANDQPELAKPPAAKAKSKAAQEAAPAANTASNAASKAEQNKAEQKPEATLAKKPELIKPVPRSTAIEQPAQTAAIAGNSSSSTSSTSSANPVSPTSSGKKASKTSKPGKSAEPDKTTISVGSAPKNNREQPARPQLHRPKPVKDAVLIERGITAPTEPKPQQILQPPVRPTAKPVAKDDEATETDGAEIAAKPPGLELAAPPERPIKLSRVAAKVNKRGKTKREEEEEEDTEVRAKKPNRLKRYKVIEDDIDDIDDDLENGDLDDASNLSTARPTARPPKPKQARSTGAENKPIPAKPSRKPARDRRSSQPEKQIEKPELIELSDSVTVQELADQMLVSETEVIRTLFMKGVMVNINQTLDVPTARMVAEELGYEVEEIETDAPARKITEMIDLEDIESLVRRPPVVTIMGHVDHGKTTLLDSIRESKVAQGEAGGITQHIGAYHVDVEHEDGVKQVVFLDTPGHEAFTAMRARGARVTDIAILVVAADDGVQPQTIEAISHAKAANVPIVVAINKVDKPEAQPDRIRQELTEYGLVDEEWGGETIMVPVSAIEGSNLDTLLEMILLVAEIEDLQANPDRTARGTIIEAHLDKARGPVATFLVQNGTLRVGDVFVAGSVFGKVRAMIDDRGERVDAADPSFAVEVLGLNEVPAAGDEFQVYLEEKKARSLASDRAEQQRQSRLQQTMSSRRVTLGTVSAQAQEGELKELNLILKADVQGSVEAILGSLEQLPQEEVQIRVLLSAPGEITENDVELAAASDAVIIGFNTSMATGARQAADNLGVDVRDYDVIYKLLEDIRDAMEGLLEPELVEEHLGQAEVRALFTVGKGVVAGCYVQSGKLIRNCKVRVLRKGEVITTGSLDSLKRMREDAKEVASGFECGVGIDRFASWQEGDIVDAYRMVTKRRTLKS